MIGLDIDFSTLFGKIDCGAEQRKRMDELNFLLNGLQEAASYCLAPLGSNEIK